jgi:hypothetical protein
MLPQFAIKDLFWWSLATTCVIFTQVSPRMCTDRQVMFPPRLKANAHTCSVSLHRTSVKMWLYSKTFTCPKTLQSLYACSFFTYYVFDL